MKVAVTGGSGQLGSLVLRRLLDDRSIAEVVTLDRRPPAVPGGKLRVVEADVRDPEIGRHFEGCDAVIHLAFMLAQHAERSLVDAVNVGGSRNVFRAAVAKGVKTIVYSSSVAAYGVTKGHSQPLVETSPRRLVRDFAYSANKYEVEELLDAFEKEHPDVAVARIRPTVLVGRYMDHPLGVAMRFRRLPDNGDTPLPLVWDEDVADAVVLAMKKRARGAWNTVAAEALPARELAARTGMKLLEVPTCALRTWAHLSGPLERVGLARRTDPAWLGKGDVPMVASSAKAIAELGWAPRCPTNVAVLERFHKVAPRVTDPRIPLFLWSVALATQRGLADADLGGFDQQIHLRLDGPTGGDFGITVKAGAISVAWGVPRPPTATVTMEAPFLLDLLAGRADPATAQLTGRMRVHGDGHATFVVSGLVSSFRAGVGASGARGRASRVLDRLFALGGAR